MAALLMRGPLDVLPFFFSPSGRMGFGLFRLCAPSFVLAHWSQRREYSMLLSQ